MWYTQYWFALLDQADQLAGLPLVFFLVSFVGLVIVTLLVGHRQIALALARAGHMGRGVKARQGKGKAGSKKN